jgi:hypothetical protein
VEEDDTPAMQAALNAAAGITVSEDENSPYAIQVTNAHITINPKAKASGDCGVIVSGNTVHITGTWKWDEGAVLLQGPGTITLNGPTETQPPTVELLDSSNPFARALDAWQTGKAGWVKGTFFRRIDPEKELSA